MGSTETSTENHEWERVVWIWVQLWSMVFYALRHSAGQKGLCSMPVAKRERCLTVARSLLSTLEEASVSAGLRLPAGCGVSTVLAESGAADLEIESLSADDSRTLVARVVHSWR